MRNKSENIEDIFLKILKEEIETKSKSMSKSFGEWMEIETNEELHGKQKKLDVANPKGKLTKADFDALRRKRKKKYEESEMEEGNEFTGALAKARKQGKDTFKVDGKTYNVEESRSRFKNRNNINKLKLTEDELIDLIENIVKEQTNEVTDLDNMSTKTPEGLKKTRKVQEKSKKENEDYAKEVVKKMKEYLDAGSNGEYEENPNYFPKSNGELGEMKKKSYKASKAVEEYIENFAYPGLENLHYDEIKPNDKWLEKNIVGSSETGNNPEWANSVKTDLGDKINKKRKNNFFDKEKDRSYKRVTQPVDEAGDGEGEDKLDKMFINLESVNNKKGDKVIVEIDKIKNLFNYNAKTQ
jgi:hypothetical protein